MTTTEWTPADTQKALAIWKQYQDAHDVSAQKGQAVGIDPVSGRVWFGASALEIGDQMRAEGIDRPFYSIRVGYDYYVRKGGRR